MPIWEYVKRISPRSQNAHDRIDFEGEEAKRSSPESLVFFTPGGSMKHAGQAALATIEPLLVELRALEGLVEKRPGVFYRKSAAFLHFHEDPAGMFADVRLEGEWQRMPVNTSSERRHLIRLASQR
jgi:hypothetical protein